jgi:hypothetical protein
LLFTGVEDCAHSYECAPLRGTTFTPDCRAHLMALLTSLVVLGYATSAGRAATRKFHTCNHAGVWSDLSQSQVCGLPHPKYLGARMPRRSPGGCSLHAHPSCCLEGAAAWCHVCDAGSRQTALQAADGRRCLQPPQALPSQHSIAAYLDTQRRGVCKYCAKQFDRWTSTNV